MERDNGRFVPQLMQIAGFKARLLQLPDVLHKARLTLADSDRDIAGIKRRLTDAKDAVKDSEHEIAFEVAEAKLAPAETDKPGTAPRSAFPNETSRKTETQRRVRESPAHQVLVKAVDEVEAELFQAEHTRRLRALDVEKLEDEQRALQGHSDLTEAETMLLVAGR
jgi:hypothetical protein